MTFTAASALWGLLALAALPFLIHWLSRRSPKRFLFSSLDDLKKSLGGRSRLFKWRHFLFLLVRSLAVIALVLAFLRPVIGLNEEETSGRRHVILLVDRSLSMAHEDDNTSTWKRARLEAGKLLRSLDPLDRVIPILVGRTPEAGFSQFTHNITEVERFLDSAEPQAVQADFRAANQLAAQLAAKADGPVDFVYLSDFQRKNWAAVQFDALPQNANLLFVPATDDNERRNQAILSAEPTGTPPTRGQPFEITARIGNYSRDTFNGRLEARVAETLLADRTISLPPWGEGDFTLTIPGLEAGLHSAELRLSPDDLPLDNQFWLPLEIRDTEGVAILTEDGGSGDSARFLKAAVNPFREGGQGSYRVLEMTGREITPASLSGTSKIIISKAPALNRGQANTLAGFLRSGGGALLFLDGSRDITNLSLIAETIGTELPLAPTAKLSSENLAGGAMKIAEGDFRSPYLRLFQGERRRNLGFLEFYHLYHATSTGKGRILLRYADGTPALTATQVGLGTLLIANFSVGELSSNIARQQLFPGWIHDILGHLSPADTSQTDYLAGDQIYSEAWTSDSMGRELIGPNGDQVRVTSEIRGERVFFNFSADKPGVYTLPSGKGPPLQIFAVNSTTRESDLRTLDPSVLPSRSPESATTGILDGALSLDQWARGLPAFHWFVLASLAFLALESLLHLVLHKPRKEVPA